MTFFAALRKFFTVEDRDTRPGALLMVPLTASEMYAQAGMSRIYEERIGMLPPDILAAMDKVLLAEMDGPALAEAGLADDESRYQGLPKGTVYVLINPAMPGLVKIGWTKGPSEERARQLSAVTGVAASFVVAYEEVVVDAADVERQIHEALADFRYNLNREFFKIPVKNAISTVRQICRTIGEPVEDTWNVDSPLDWEDLLNKAENYHYGFDSVRKDTGRAILLYQRAAALGAEEAYLGLADIYLDEFDEPDTGRAVTWLKKGAEAGVAMCYYQLAQIYAGVATVASENYADSNSAVEWLRRCVKEVPINESTEYVLFVALRLYVKLIGQLNLPQADQYITVRFKEQFLDYLSGFGDDPHYAAKQEDVRALFSRSHK